MLLMVYTNYVMSRSALRLGPRSLTRGFTIVELLIVIIVIAILAIIVIAAYNGVTQRAHAAAAEADANSLSKLLTVSYSTNGTYPSDLTTVNNGRPMPSSDGTTYTYHPSNGNANFCSTITNGSTSYVVTDTAATPTPGACPGDGLNGVPPITNYALDPDATSTTDFGQSGSGSSIAAATTSIDTTQVHHGTTALKRAISGSGQTGAAVKIPSQGMKVLAGATMSWSFWVYSTRAGSINPWADAAKVSDGSYTACSGSAVSIPANAWTRVTATCTAPVDLYPTQVGGYNLTVQSGDTVWFDQYMVTTGSSVANYADGNTSGWVWNGTANNATSTGPAQ